MSETETKQPPFFSCKVKGSFPFRVGTSSYIIPDDIVPNVEFLSSVVDDVELILFESREVSNLPDSKVIRRLVQLKEAYNLSFTVHLPLDIWLGSVDEKVRISSVNKCVDVITLTEPLYPFAYILHLHRDNWGVSPAQDIGSWRRALRRSLSDILECKIPPEKLCIETLDYPFEYVEDIVNDFYLSVCLDAGHLLLHGFSLDGYFQRYMDRCKVVHFHGVKSGKDHLDIAVLDKDTVKTVVDYLSLDCEVERVLTIEVFNKKHLYESLNMLCEVR